MSETTWPHVHFALLLPFLALAMVFFVLWLRRLQQVRKLQKRYSPVIDIDVEVAKVSRDRDALASQIGDLQTSYKEKKAVYDRLIEQVAIFDEQLAFAELGMYRPHFDFGDSELYKNAIGAVREEQKAVIDAKAAVVVRTVWTLDGSKAKGQTMSNRAIRLTLRAFNAEADAAIANTRWNNAEGMIRRIETARSQIDKANASLHVQITEEYLQLKLKELRLTHEYREQLKAEREVRAEEARQKREEQRLERDAEEARREEEKYEALLAKARKEAGVVASDLQTARIAELETELAAAQAKARRAEAMAERTKSGFVYIVSNVGSFGEGVVKIGLTRRLDPADRVRELGGASVPFVFDTHAMIYSEEAPALEAALHAQFEERRVNAANMRKEFFRVTLEEVENAVHRVAPEADFHKDIEAQEFRETMARRQLKLEAELRASKLVFPDAI